MESIEEEGIRVRMRERADSTATPGHHSSPYLSLATFRMVVLADEVSLDETRFEG